MLIISQQQIAAFRDKTRPRALEELKQWLISEHPQLERSPDLVSRVEMVITEAEELGLASKRDVYTYARLRVAHGFDLSTDSDLRAVLEAVDVPAHDRMTMFLLRKPPAFWRRSSVLGTPKEPS